MDIKTASQPKMKIAHKDGKTEQRKKDSCYVCMWYHVIIEEERSRFCLVVEISFSWAKGKQENKEKLD